MSMRLRCIGLGTLLFSVACTKSQDRPSPWVIKTYKTDVAQADASVKTLNHLLNPDPVKAWLHKGNDYDEVLAQSEPSRGSARVAGAGLIAVNASEEIQAGIPDLVAQIAKAQAKPLTQLQTEGWLLVAIPAPKRVPLPAALQARLAAFDQEYPGRCVVEVDHFLVDSVEGNKFQVQGDLTKMKGYVMNAAGKVLADLEFSGKLVDFSSQVTLIPGEAVIISQAMRHAKTLPSDVLARCGVAADTALDLHTLVAIKSAQLDSK